MDATAAANSRFTIPPVSYVGVCDTDPIGARIP